MGCGKSFLGPGLATRLGLPFVDLDALIAQAEGASIESIFAQKGETAFRYLEQRYLKESVVQAPYVLATGGGTPCFFENLEWMQAQGITIYLKTPVSVLAARLQKAQTTRPLLAAIPDADLEQFIDKMLQERAPFYMQAQIIAEYAADTEFLLDGLFAQIQAVKKLDT
jgi:shikimate kinase